MIFFFLISGAAFCNLLFKWHVCISSSRRCVRAWNCKIGNSQSEHSAKSAHRSICGLVHSYITVLSFFLIVFAMRAKDEKYFKLTALRRVHVLLQDIVRSVQSSACNVGCAGRCAYLREKIIVLEMHTDFKCNWLWKVYFAKFPPTITPAPRTHI